MSMFPVCVERLAEPRDLRNMMGLLSYPMGLLSQPIPVSSIIRSATLLPFFAITLVSNSRHLS